MNSANCRSWFWDTQARLGLGVFLNSKRIDYYHLLDFMSAGDRILLLSCGWDFSYRSGVERFETAAPGESAAHLAPPRTDCFRESRGSRSWRGAQDASDGAAHSGLSHLPLEPCVSRGLVLARSRLTLQLSCLLCHRHRGPAFRARRRDRPAFASSHLL